MPWAGCSTVNFFCAQLSTVYYAKINADGSTGAWITNANPLPNGAAGSATVVSNGYIYSIGGKNSNTTVNYAKLKSDGSTGAWVTSPNSLTSNRAEGGVVTYGGYVYMFGGHSGGGSPDNVVIYSKLGADGTIGPWVTSANNLATAMKQPGVIYANGYVYLFGGINGGNSPDSTVQYARINSDGTPGVWSNLSTLPIAIGVQKATVMNGFVYLVGGYDGTNNVATVYKAKLNNDGTLGNWSVSSNPLPATRSGQGTLGVNGYIYAIGGDTTGSVVTNSVLYARLRFVHPVRLHRKA